MDLIDEDPSYEADILGINEAPDITEISYSSRESLDSYVPPMVHLVLVILGLSANIIVATVVAGNRSMHSAANCFVFSIIFSDLVVLSDDLLNQLRYWFKSPLNIDGSYIDCMTLEASVLTIVMFALERYVALCHPESESERTFGFCNGVKSILIIWSVAATIPAMELNLNLHFLPNTRALIFLMSTMMFLLLPTLVILTLAAFTLVDTKSLKNNLNQDASKLFVALTLVFYVSMAPYRMVSLVRFMAPAFCCSQAILKGSYLIVELSAAVNPILYGFVSRHFRTAFKVYLLLAHPTLGKYRNFLIRKKFTILEMHGNASEFLSLQQPTDSQSEPVIKRLGCYKSFSSLEDITSVEVNKFIS